MSSGQQGLPFTFLCFPRFIQCLEHSRYLSIILTAWLNPGPHQTPASTSIPGFWSLSTSNAGSHLSLFLSLSYALSTTSSYLCPVPTPIRSDQTKDWGLQRLLDFQSLVLWGVWESLPPNHLSVRQSPTGIWPMIFWDWRERLSQRDQERDLGLVTRVRLSLGFLLPARSVAFIPTHVVLNRDRENHEPGLSGPTTNLD